MAIDGGWTETDYAQTYRIGDLDQNGARVAGYTRRLMVDQFKARGMPTLFSERWANLVRDLPIYPAERGLVVGAGFGGLIEEAHDAGFPLWWGIDSSPYIEANRGTEVRGDVVMVADDIRGGGRVRSALRSATGDDEFAWIVTEDVVPCYPDSELSTLVPLVETLLEPGAPTTNVVHITTLLKPNGVQDPRMNWKSLADWKSAFPNHTWTDAMADRKL